jgi:hypothetical protein
MRVSNSNPASSRKEVEEDVSQPYWGVICIIAGMENLYPSELYDLIKTRMSPTRTFSNAVRTFALAYYISSSASKDKLSVQERETLQGDVEDWLDGRKAQMPLHLMKFWSGERH